MLLLTWKIVISTLKHLEWLELEWWEPWHVIYPVLEEHCISEGVVLTVTLSGALYKGIETFIVRCL